jgi:hypothetical protein
MRCTSISTRSVVAQAALECSAAILATDEETCSTVSASFNTSLEFVLKIHI